VVITDHGKPALEVRPYREVKRNPLAALRGTLVRYDDPTEPISVDWDSQK
jgi:antitoxin (DNA-binding transcriptional repressor) of toxin-antitoxin stability system